MATIAELERHATNIATELDVVGLINVQFAVKGGDVYVIEANPRASRTVPFVAKATGVALAKIAARVMMGETIAELREIGLVHPPVTGHVSVKEAVLPFNRFPDADPLLGPEMRSTGEVMGIDSTTGLAFTKSQMAAGGTLPEGGTIFLSLADRDKVVGIEAARRFVALGFNVIATAGTSAALERAGVKVGRLVAKVTNDGLGRDIDELTAVDLIASGDIQLVVNSPRGRGPRADGAYIRAAAGSAGIPLLTTGSAALAAARGMEDWLATPLQVRSLQSYHRGAVV